MIFIGATFWENFISHHWALIQLIKPNYSEYNKLFTNLFSRTPPKTLPKVFRKPEKKDPKTELKPGTAPLFTIKPRPRDLVEGMQIRLSCGANGTPDPDFTWYKNGQLVQSDERVQIKSTVGMSSLIIKDSEVEDGGVYKAVAKNRAGEIEAEAEVVVEGKIS